MGKTKQDIDDIYRQKTIDPPQQSRDKISQKGYDLFDLYKAIITFKFLLNLLYFIRMESWTHIIGLCRINQPAIDIWRAQTIINIF